VGTLGGIAAQGGVGILGGIGARGAPCILCRCASGISSSLSSSSSVKPATTLRHFRPLSSLSIINGPPCLGGQWTSSSRKAPLVRGASQLPSSSSVVPARLRRLASHRRACQRHTLFLGPGHRSCKHQIRSYGCGLATININLTLWVIFDIPMVAALSTCMPSSCSIAGGILSGRTAALTTSSHPCTRGSLQTPWWGHLTPSTHTMGAPAPFTVAPACR
jgi:hypothetical protein